MLFALLTLGSCMSPQPFCTDARYVAPRGRFQVVLSVAGEVSRGADVSENGRGFALLCPKEGEDIVLLTDQDVGAPSVDGMAGRLARQGIVADSAELIELRLAIEGALAGPKGTLMQGQSRALEVARVRTRYERCVPKLPPDCRAPEELR